MDSCNIRAGELLLRSIDPLQLDHSLLVIQIIGKRTKCTVTEQQVDLFKGELLRFLKHLSARILSMRCSRVVHTLKTNQIVGNVTKRLKATKMK
jgi:hypothetical protein